MFLCVFFTINDLFAEDKTFCVLFTNLIFYICFQLFSSMYSLFYHIFTAFCFISFFYILPRIIVLFIFYSFTSKWRKNSPFFLQNVSKMLEVLLNRVYRKKSCVCVWWCRVKKGIISLWSHGSHDNHYKVIKMTVSFHESNRAVAFLSMG